MTGNAESPTSGKDARILVWGTYDLGKPRTRLLLSSLRHAGFDVAEVHTDIWSAVEDKSRVTSPGSRLGFALRWLTAYPGLIWRYLRAPRHDLVVVPYLGHLDVIVLWPFARLRGVPIVWDAFLSLLDTVVDDRKLASSDGIVAKLVRTWEWLACRAADRVVLDTKAQARMFASTFHISESRVSAVMVGAESAVFAPLPAEPDERARPEEVLKILFYGQFIPLHGIATIVEAAQLAGDRPWRWTIIGEGQESEAIDRSIAEGPQFNLDRHKWVPYEDLRRQIAAADICLGIFGTSGKAGRVIPNKAFQILAAGKPLITRKSPAMEELLIGDEPGVALVEPGDPHALVQAIETLAQDLPAIRQRPGRLHEGIVARFSEQTLSEAWRQVMYETMKRHRKSRK